ncbi:MAG: hypothetical protein KDC57_07765 [Saprospiraceae bacterium]|nr:hypothetical protein [Saprospiraceae bacterium]
MKMLEILAQEMQQEAITTRKMLERIPEDRFDWQPHPKSMTMERLANHLAEIPGWVELTLTTDELDFARNPYVPTTYRTTKSLLSFFEDNLQEALDALNNAKEGQLSEPWALRRGEMILSEGSRIEFLRQVFCQIVHHRAQLGVYLRLLDVPIPGSYGPSADELIAMEAATN